MEGRRQKGSPITIDHHRRRRHQLPPRGKKSGIEPTALMALLVNLTHDATVLPAFLPSLTPLATTFFCPPFFPLSIPLLDLKVTKQEGESMATSWNSTLIEISVPPPSPRRNFPY
jgi:hypothetical protein